MVHTTGGPAPRKKGEAAEARTHGCPRIHEAVECRSTTHDMSRKTARVSLFKQLHRTTVVLRRGNKAFIPTQYMMQIAIQTNVHVCLRPASHA
jgi:hypothetical protein